LTFKKNNLCRFFSLLLLSFAFGGTILSHCYLVNPSKFSGIMMIKMIFLQWLNEKLNCAN